ncbi:MAG: LysM peptidoglycan-binding domain-containing protein [Muribaculaceae bacterium]|nr:LysM peptidoglycan-binding domain-containing protein [Muribaculaceae bacterium]
MQKIKVSIFNWLIIGLIILISGAFYLKAESTTKLSKTEILGKEYYIYDTKKGESVYGIAKKYGWDPEELMRLNPDASGIMPKGVRLYYPTGLISKVTEIPKPVEIDPSTLEPVKHKVKKGETIYSISRQYGAPLEIIYKYNPGTQKGVKVGEIIEIPQNGTGQYYFYKIKHGDTLSSISQKFNTSVEDILQNNAGLTVSNIKEGEVIRIRINSNVGKVKTEMVAEDRISQISGYKVSKKETWSEISEKTGVDEEILKEANSSDNTPEENSIVNVPIVETIEVERTIGYTPQEEISDEEVQEIYDSIKGVAADSIEFTGVRIALILDEPSSKKDIDFTRGFLVGLSDFENSNFTIDMKVIDGRVSSNNLVNELDDYEPNLIISTADKAFPLFLADYGNTNQVQIVNVFDLKNDLYEDNSSIIQILPPSSFFNDRIATKLYRENMRRDLMTVGEKDENDGISAELFKLYDGNGEVLSLEDFGNYEPDIMKSAIIYSYATKKEEVSDFLKNVENLAENYPGFDFRIIGRSSWISMIDEFGDQFKQYNVYVPSRVWLDEDSKAWNSFIEKYDELFSADPIRSIPNFAASGYDIANYFIPIVAENHGDFNKIPFSSNNKALQNEITLSRVNNWGGFINEIGYIISFLPNGKIEKTTVK